MSKPANINQKERVTRIRHKPDYESTLQRTFATARHNTNRTECAEGRQQGSGLLQRQCTCGKHTIAGGECSECRSKRESTLQRRAINTGSDQRALSHPDEARALPPISSTRDFSRVPLRGTTLQNKAALQTKLTPHTLPVQYEPAASQNANHAQSTSATFSTLPVNRIADEFSHGLFNSTLSATAQIQTHGAAIQRKEPAKKEKPLSEEELAKLRGKAKALGEKLSYSLFDWAITDADARAVIKELAVLNDSKLSTVLGMLGAKKTARLMDNLSKADRRKYAATVVRVIRLSSVKANMAYIKSLLSYGIFDWAITDNDASRVVEVLETLTPAQFTELRGKLTAKQWARLMDNLPKDKLEALSDKVRRAAHEGNPAALEPDGKIIGSAQTNRAKDKYNSLKSKDQKKFRDLLKAAKSVKEQFYLFKALASGYDLGEIKKFADRIRGKDKKWLQNNLRLTQDTKGGGIKQQWSHSCNITTVQAVRGELDPIYALKLHDENPDLGKVDDKDATKKNPKLAAEQKAGLESKYAGSKFSSRSGVAANRGDAGGSGRWADDKLNAISDVTGIKYTTKLVGTDITLSKAIDALDEGLGAGMPVPIVIGNGAKQYTHYVLVTGKKDGPPKSYTIHDPWSGKTVTRSAKRMKKGTLNIANSNQMTAIEVPATK